MNLQKLRHLELRPAGPNPVEPDHKLQFQGLTWSELQGVRLM